MHISYGILVLAPGSAKSSKAKVLLKYNDSNFLIGNSIGINPATKLRGHKFFRLLSISAYYHVCSGHNKQVGLLLA